ncbi:MAG: TatD family hydrolase [Elusimicrobiota bacterium]|jgi:TatD DNase family protein|nr:TatD family hydrolase [Elusimicrobiota bacterium]
MFDTHTHLSDPVFNCDLQNVLDRAKEAGISTMIDVSCQQDLWNKSLALAKYPEIYSAFGIHPHEAKTAAPADFIELEKLLAHPKCVAVGEAGLDYYYNHSPSAIQKEIFIKHIDLALRFNKPLIIHCRDAYDDMFEILAQFKTLPPAVMHSFDGNAKQAQTLIDMGFYIGVCSVITFKNADDFRQTLTNLDCSKLLLETDCPYRAPVPFRGKRSEPAFVKEVAKVLAKIKNMDVNEIENITTKNAKTLFFKE